MFQPRVKLEFVRRYTPPSEGWLVYVDVDPSELGRTGGENIGEEARRDRVRMQQEGNDAVERMRALGVQVGGGRFAWRTKHGLPEVIGDRDIAAFHPFTNRCIIAEAEGASSGQPEQKLYKAIGQLVLAAGEVDVPGWEVSFVLVAYGEKIARHLRRAGVLPKINIYALDLTEEERALDHWIFGRPPLLS